MQVTYETAMAQVFKSEGGYTNNVNDPGGPTNWGITTEDARKYWLQSATAQDIQNMPRSVAEDIYKAHYATPIQYDNLPAGVDYTVLDYAINSGVSRSIKVLQSFVGVTQDGVMGPATLTAVASANPVDLIDKIWAERLKFLKSLPTWGTFGAGWNNRVIAGKALALGLNAQYGTTVPQISLWGNAINSVLKAVQTLLPKGKSNGSNNQPSSSGSRSGNPSS